MVVPGRFGSKSDILLRLQLCLLCSGWYVKKWATLMDKPVACR